MQAFILFSTLSPCKNTHFLVVFLSLKCEFPCVDFYINQWDIQDFLCVLHYWFEAIFSFRHPWSYFIFLLYVCCHDCSPKSLFSEYTLRQCNLKDNIFARCLKCEELYLKNISNSMIVQMEGQRSRMWWVQKKKFLKVFTLFFRKKHQ